MSENNTHPTDQQLSAFHDGEITGDEQTVLSRHLAWCEACVRRMEELRAISSLIASNAHSGLSQIAMRRLHDKLDEVMERGLVRWAWEVSGIAAAVLLVGSIWLAQMAEPASAATAVIPPWVGAQASVDTAVDSGAREATTPAAVWYMADARTSDSNP
jgi:anti-sigma factor RsiW